MTGYSRWLTVALAALTLSIPVLAACGGGTKKVEAKEWAANFCDATLDFKEASDDLEAEFDEIDFEDDKAHEEFADLISQQRDELDDFVKEFEKLGEPDIEEGPAVVEEISEALDEYREFLTELVDELEKADDFMEGMSALEDVEEPEGVRVRLEELDDNDVDDLIEEMDEEEECLDTLAPDDGGSSAAVPVEEWTEGFCLALTSWLEDVSAAAAATTFDPNASGQVIKNGLVAFFEEIDARTKQMEDDVFFLGVPDIEDGIDIQLSLEAAITDATFVFSDALADVKALDASNATQMRASLTEIGDRLNEAADIVGESFTAIDDEFDMAEVVLAAEDIPECEGIF